MTDPRDEKCSVNKWEKHRWSRSFKDTISKAHFVQILRCRYCARFVCVEFKRVILPSGRVTVEERAFETVAGQVPTIQLREVDADGVDVKPVELAR